MKGREKKKDWIEHQDPKNDTRMSSLGLHSISYEKDWVLQKLVTQKHQQAKRKQSFQSLLSVDKGLREEKTSKTNLF